LLVDGQFGEATFDAIAEFQKSQHQQATGVLSGAELALLEKLADGTQQKLGMRRVSDTPAHVSLMIPANLLTRRMPTEQGTSYVSADGEISLETMHAALTDQSFRELYDAMTAPDAERTVTYHSYGNNRFVVSGVIGAYSFYTMFVSAGDEAVGYSLAWGEGYAHEGSVSSVWLASHFTPLASLPPGTRPKFSGPPPSTFELPADKPDVIALTAEIGETTAADFDRALAARPGATTVVLDSPGGSVENALAIAQEVKRRGLRTYIPDGMGCYSACAYIFFAGQNRIADGELGVHQISLDVEDVVMAQMTMSDVLEALDGFGVKQKVITYMLRTPPEGMYVFSRPELSELGINRGEPIRVAVKAEPVALVGTEAAYVQLASQSSRSEADRSLQYAEGRWAPLFGEIRPEVEAASGQVFRVRLPAGSVERASAICAAIKADGGGCYVTTGN
jgi:hypothetical protein